jgi:hypothetical protein
LNGDIALSQDSHGGERTRAASHHAFPAEYQRGLYEAIFRRRDIRKFIPDAVPDEVLARVIVAAHHAASVGFTQPWDFLVVRDTERRARSNASSSRSARSTPRNLPAIVCASFAHSSSMAFSKRRSI